MPTRSRCSISRTCWMRWRRRTRRRGGSMPPSQPPAAPTIWRRRGDLPTWRSASGIASRFIDPIAHSSGRRKRPRGILPLPLRRERTGMSVRAREDRSLNEHPLRRTLTLPSPGVPAEGKDAMSRDALICLVLFCVVALLFAPARKFSFVNYDDPEFVGDPHVRGGLSSEGFRWSLTAVKL